jgi:AcrR family transcriptional regulator
MIFCQTSISEWFYSKDNAAIIVSVEGASVTESGTTLAKSTLDKSIVGQQRETMILEASFKVFTRYGFSRTTMDDIAREAGISRPALYQHFKNKKDIYRGFAERMTWQMTDGLKAMLATEGEPESVLNAAFEACVIQPMRQFSITEHGHELLDMKNELAADIMAAMLGREHKVLSAFFQRHGQNTRTGDELASLLIDALEGAKSRTPDVESFAVSLRSTIGFVARLLQ